MRIKKNSWAWPLGWGELWISDSRLSPCGLWCAEEVLSSWSPFSLSLLPGEAQSHFCTCRGWSHPAWGHVSDLSLSLCLSLPAHAPETNLGWPISTRGVCLGAARELWGGNYLKKHLIPSLPWGNIYPTPGCWDGTSRDGTCTLWAKNFLLKSPLNLSKALD